MTLIALSICILILKGVSRTERTPDSKLSNTNDRSCRPRNGFDRQTWWYFEQLQRFTGSGAISRHG